MRMKSTLLTGSAVGLCLLAVPGAAAEWEITVGGYYNSMLAYGQPQADTGNGLDDQDGLGLAQDAEIFFRPQITLDNGIKFSATVDVDFQNEEFVVDEPELRITGSFGSFVIGSNEDASLNPLVAPDLSINSETYDGTSTVPNWGHQPRSFRDTLFGNAFDIAPIQGLQSGVNRANPFAFDSSVISTTLPYNDARETTRRITYFTPRFAGFQLGVSYAQDNEYSPNPLRDCSMNSCNFFDVGLSYSGDFDGLRLAAGLGYGTGDTNDPNRTPELVQGHVSIGYAGFTLGGSWAEQNESSGGEYDGTSYSIGGTYNPDGPWSFGLTYFHGEMVDFMHVGFGPRVSLCSTFLDASYQANERTNLSVYLGHVNYREDVGDGGFGTPGDNLASFVIGTGIGLSF